MSGKDQGVPDLLDDIDAWVNSTHSMGRDLANVLDRLRACIATQATDLAEARQALMSVAHHASSCPLEHGYGGASRVLTVSDDTVARWRRIATGDRV